MSFVNLARLRWRSWAGTFVVFITLAPLSRCAFDAGTKFTWLDSSCDGKGDLLNTAGQNMVDLAAAGQNAINNPNEVIEKTMKSFFKRNTDAGILIANNYGKIAAFGDEGKSTGYSLYCDGSAFKFVTTYQENDGDHKEGDELDPADALDGGAWYATRRKPGDPALYVKSEKRDDYCQHPTLKNSDGTPKEAAGVSTRGGTHVILCPAAFSNTIDLASAQGTVYDDGKLLSDFDGLSTTLLHEVTHCLFRTFDYQYGAMQCLIMANMPTGGPKSQNNADSYVYFSVAAYLNKNAWFTTRASKISSGDQAATSAVGGSRRRAIEARMAHIARYALTPTTLIKRRLAPRSLTPCWEEANAPHCKTVGAQQSVVVATVSGRAITETFVPTTFAEWKTLTATTTIRTMDSQGRDASIVIGPGGLGWKLPELTSGEPLLPEPTVLPSNVGSQITNGAGTGTAAGGAPTETPKATDSQGQTAGGSDQTTQIFGSTGGPLSSVQQASHGPHTTGGSGQTTGGQAQTAGGSLLTNGQASGTAGQGSMTSDQVQSAGSARPTDGQGQPTASQDQTTGGNAQPTDGQGQTSRVQNPTTGAQGQTGGGQQQTTRQEPGETDTLGGPASSTPLPPGAVVVSSSVSGQEVVETFMPTTISSLTTLESSLSTFSSVGPSSSVPIVIGPGGVAWQIPSVQPGVPELLPPTTLPGGANPTRSGAGLSSVPSGVTSSAGGPTSLGVTSANNGNDPSQTDTPGKTTKPPQSDGQITAAPLPTITNTDPIELESFSVLPPGVTGNTLLHTTDGGGHDVTFPFLWGCFFCGGGGLALEGFGIKPGIYPPPTPPPVENFPTMTIGKDGIPTPGPEPDGDGDDDPSTENGDQTEDQPTKTADEPTRSTGNPTTSKPSGSTSGSPTRSSVQSSSTGSEDYTVEDADYFSIETYDAAATASASSFIASLAGSPASTDATATGTAGSGASTDTPATGTAGSGAAPTRNPTATNDVSATGKPATSSKPEVPSSTKAKETSIAATSKAAATTEAEEPEPTTESKPPPSPTVAPFETPSQPSCYPTPTGDYKDSHEGNVEKASNWFCNEFATGTSHNETIYIEHTGWASAEEQFWDSNDYNDDVYDITLSSIDGCDPGPDGYNLYQPIPVDLGHCATLLQNAWHGCNNKGRGGIIKAGCLSFSLRTVY